MNLSQYTYTDLLQIRREIDTELLFRRETTYNNFKQYAFIYASELIDYINKSENIDVTKRIRREIFTFSRFTVMNHLYEKGMNKSDIGRAFEKDHATVINCLKQYKELSETNFDRFIGVRDRIETLIKTFENDKTKTEPITTDIQAKCGEATQFNRH